MKNNIDAYITIDDVKRKKSPILPDVEGSIDSFNHAVGGIGDIPGTGMSMTEAKEDDIPVGDDIFKAILNQFPVTDFPEKGASFILPSGKFLDPDKAHGEVEEFIVDNFPQIDIMDYPNGYMVDSEQCIRVNDGRGKSFTLDRYITLPKYITADQIYALEDWLKEYPYESITVSDTFGHIAEFNLEEDGITYLMNRIRKYKNTQILSEGYDSINEAEDIVIDNEDEESKLPDLAEENIIGQEDAGISSMFIDLINSCWDMIDTYHSVIVTLDSLDRHDFDETLQGLLEERNKEVGALQGILELLSPASSQIEQGKAEAQDQVAFDEIEDDLNLGESYIKESTKYSISDLSKGDIVVIQRQHKLNSKSILIPVNVFGVGTYGPNTFSGGQGRGGECDISWVVYKASSWDDAKQWISKHRDYSVKELANVILTEEQLDEEFSLHEDFSGQELTRKNLLVWFEKNHPKYLKRLAKELGQAPDNIILNQFTQEDIYNLLDELKLVKSLCSDFGITEDEYYSKSMTKGFLD